MFDKAWNKLDDTILAESNALFEHGNNFNLLLGATSTTGLLHCLSDFRLAVTGLDARVRSQVAERVPPTARPNDYKAVSMVVRLMSDLHAPPVKGHPMERDIFDEFGESVFGLFESFDTAANFIASKVHADIRRAYR